MSLLFWCEIDQLWSITREVVFLECLELDLLLWWCWCGGCCLDLFISSLDCLCFWLWYWCLLGLSWCAGLLWCWCRLGLFWPWWTLAPGLLLLPFTCPCLGVTNVMSRCQILTYHCSIHEGSYLVLSKLSNWSSSDDNNGNTLFLPSHLVSAIAEGAIFLSFSVSNFTPWLPVYRFSQLGNFVTIYNPITRNWATFPTKLDYFFKILKIKNLHFCYCCFCCCGGKRHIKNSFMSDRWFIIGL